MDDDDDPKVVTETLLAAVIDESQETASRLMSYFSDWHKLCIAIVV
jgi:hypothetical protein